MSPIPSTWMHDDYKDFLVAEEEDYGVVDELIFSGLRGWDFNPVWLEADEKELAYTMQFGGNRDFDLLAKRSTLSFKLPAVGSGGALTGLPPWHPIARACRAQVAATPPTAAATIAAVAVAGAGADGVWTYARTDAYGGLFNRTVTLTCTNAGGSGVAEFTVSAPAAEYLPAYEETGAVMTTAAEFPLPGGASITPAAITTPFELGDSYTIGLTASGAVYRPASAVATHGSCAIRCFMQDPSLPEGDVRVYLMRGCRGTMKLTGAASDYPYFEVTLTSLFTEPASAAAVAVDYDETWMDPVEVSTQNTPIRRVFGHDLIVTQFGVDFGVDAKLVSRVGREGVQALDHKASMTMTAEEPGLAEWNVMADVIARTRGAMTLQHGIVPGNALRLSSSCLRLGKPGRSAHENAVMVDLNGKFVPAAANEDWTLFVS
jgi:hypothetical protein